MDEADLRYRVFELLAEQEDPGCDVAWAAVEGEAALAAALDGGTAAAAAEPPEVDRPAGAFLASLTVEGFRGIGPAATVTFRPGPGLVIISGRNGSGKSSLAEAFELALTGTSARARMATRFGSQWRNLHHPQPTRVSVGLAQEDVGASMIDVRWSADETALERGRVTFQPHGQPQQEGLAALAWERALETYRPILAYDELSQVLREKDSQLHDSLDRMLGLELLADAANRLESRLAPIKRPLVQVQRERGDLRKRCLETADERAATAAGLLRTPTPDVAALQGLMVGITDVGSLLATLRQVAEVTLPDGAAVEAVAARLADAQAGVAGVRTQSSDLEARRRTLLTDALGYSTAAADDPACPVCGEGVLDGGWRARVEKVLHASDLINEASRRAADELRLAVRAARQLVLGAPAVTSQVLAPLAGQEAVTDAWRAWADVPDDEHLTDHLLTRLAPLRTAVAAWQLAATKLEQQQEAVWQPVAVELGGWLDRYGRARADDAVRQQLEDAQARLGHAERTLRAERLEPITTHARQIWDELKQESNVDLTDIVLAGTKTHRRVELRATVDGAEAPALAVMSQGELLALSLALFLPRAALAESPFRFIVLDDPVQAMDPAKVDGLVRVLARLAETRQVVVLTHDDRLAQAARRLPVAPRILEVVREAGSVVRVQSLLSPVERYLADARAVVKDAGLPAAARRDVLPALLRQALEAACWERVSEEQLRRGVPLADVESSWAAAHRTADRVQLALGARPLAMWRGQHHRSRALHICGSEQHQGLGGDPDEALDDVTKTVRDLQSGRV